MVEPVSSKEFLDIQAMIRTYGKEAVKKAKFNILNRHVNKLEKKITDASTLIQTYQYNTDKQYLEKKIW